MPRYLLTTYVAPHYITCYYYFCFTTGVRRWGTGNKRKTELHDSPEGKNYNGDTEINPYMEY